MIGTLLSILVGIFLWTHPYSSEMTLSVTAMENFMIAVSILFLFLVPVGTMLAWQPLQKAEQNTTPHLLEMFPKDKQISLVSGFMIGFSFVTFLTIPVFNMHVVANPWLFIIWVVLLGVATDAARYFARRIMGYLNPYEVVNLFSVRAQESIQNDREVELCHWLDGLSEIAIKGVQRHSTALSHLAIDEEQKIARLFFEASKSIGHSDKDKETAALGITDKVSYVMFYLYQRLDVIFEMAVKDRLEMTCSHIVSVLGKNAVDAAKYDISMASAPLRYLGKFAKRAQDVKLEETTMTASCVLSEVAKSLLNDIDITYCDIKDPFFSIINSMEMLAKNAFHQDKTLNISLLIVPFKELKTLFETDKMKAHQDMPAILLSVNRVIGEFEALQMVMNTLPTIPEITTTPDIQSPSVQPEA